jgi:putative phosphoesterase
MRIGIVSDIHCNAAGLQQALDLMGAVDELICAGDAIYQYRFSNEVVRLLRDSGARMVLGNHEETFLSPAGERARSSPTIDHDLLAWLAEQPASLTTRVNGSTLHVVHGSPWEPRFEYLYPHSRTLHRFRDFDADYVLMGHTHYQMAERMGRALLINPGSTGEPRDARNDWRVSFAVLDTAAKELRFCNFRDPARPSGHAPNVSPEPEWAVVDARMPE